MVRQLDRVQQLDMVQQLGLLPILSWTCFGEIHGIQQTGHKGAIQKHKGEDKIASTVLPASEEPDERADRMAQEEREAIRQEGSGRYNQGQHPA